MPARAILFDVDGTLLDTERFISGAFEAALAAIGRRPAAADAYRDVLGRPLEECYRVLAPGEDADALCDAHRRWQAAHQELVRPFAGAGDLLDRLRGRGWRLAAVTNRSARTAITSLERTGLLARLDTVVAAEDVRRQKPDPEPVRLALSRLAVAPASAVMVGDTAVDVASGRAAGTRTIGVRGGFAGDLVVEAAPDAVVATIAGVEDVIEAWWGAAGPAPDPAG